ncbi:MAG: DUF5671 domain-containing protein [bacterium]
MDNQNIGVHIDKPRATPKDFFLWAGAMLALYVGVFNYIALLWDYINYAFPDPLAYNYGYSDPYQSGISWEMASLIVLTPTFILLMWLIRKDIFKDASRNEVWVRRWALFLTLFAAGATIVGDLIYVLYAFLNGTDVTTAFLLKALVVLLVAAIGFMHFLADLWGYWAQYPTRNKYVAVGTLVLVVASILAGFFIVGTPGQARLGRFNAQKVSDLQQIQSEITNYYQAKQKLPAKLVDLNDPLSAYGRPMPMDPQTNLPYEYKTSALSFQLCASFNRESVGTANYNQMIRTPNIAIDYAPGQKTGDNWEHGTGRVCFDRTIDPQMYPSTNTTSPTKVPAPVM